MSAGVIGFALGAVVGATLGVIVTAVLVAGDDDA